MTDKRLLTEIKSFRGFKARLISNGALTFAYSLLVALLVAGVVSDTFLGHMSFKDALPRVALLALIFVLRALTTFLFSRSFRLTATRIKNSILSRYISDLLARGPSLMETAAAGGAAALVGEAAEDIEPFYFDYLPAFYTLVVSLPLTLLAVLYFDPISFFIMLITGPVLPFFLYLIGRESEKAAKARLNSLKRLGGVLLDMLSGLKTLTLFERTDPAREKVSDMSDGFRRVTMQVLRISFLSAFALELAATISTAIIAVTLGARLLYGHISFFACFSVLLLTPDYFMAIRRFGAKFHVAQNAKTAACQLYPDGNSAPAPADAGSTLPFPGGFPSVTYENVTFSYGRGAPAVSGLSMTLEPGRMTALVGPSGSGKSTVANLLLRFLTPDDGRIAVDETDLSDIELDALRRNIAYIPQRPYIFSGTLRSNITLSAPAADDEAIFAAVRNAQLDGLVSSLPGGLDTAVSDLGLNFSAGERQRIASARALLKNAPVIVIDEAVSSQDQAGECLLARAFEALAREKTVLIIAHRLESVCRADKIYFLDAGTVIEEGRHDTLMASEGAYATLVRAWEDV